MYSGKNYWNLRRRKATRYKCTKFLTSSSPIAVAVIQFVSVLERNTGCNYRKLNRWTWTVDAPRLLTHANPTSRWINALRNSLAASQVPSTRSWMQFDECTGCNRCTGRNRECEWSHIESTIMAPWNRRRIVERRIAREFPSDLSSVFLRLRKHSIRVRDS